MKIFQNRRLLLAMFLLLGLSALAMLGHIFRAVETKTVEATAGETESLAPALPPTRTTGNITFTPAATVSDTQRVESEPLNFIDRSGNILSTGPYGLSTTTSVLQRSTDGGDTFHVVAFNGLRPNPGTGGGDSDVAVDDQGNMYFIDLELANLGCAVSNDNGNVWKTNSTCVQDAGDDRQWIAIDNGTNNTIGAAGAADNTIFVGYRNVALGSAIYSSPGSTGTADPTGGVVFTNAATTAATVNNGAPCGQMRFDHVSRRLYYPCSSGIGVRLTVSDTIPVGTRTGIVFNQRQTPNSPGGGITRAVFPVVATDAAGTVYVAWTDANDRNLYYTFSTDFGAYWSAPVRVNSAPSVTTVFPWIQGGNAGNLVVAWYGTESTIQSDNMPNWATSPPAADDHKWYGYAALITNASTASPNIEQNRYTQRPMHYGQICTGGLGCATGGDRTMAEYGAIYLDASGAMNLIFNDTTSQYHGAHLFAAKQLTGPTAIGTTLNNSATSNPVTDPSGDAQSPHYSTAGPGANSPQHDFTNFRVSRPNASTVRFHFQMNSLVSMLPPPGKADSFWMARFQALSSADTGGGAEAYRVFYAGAESIGGAAPTFFMGSPTFAGPPAGCTSTTPGNCKIMQYPAEMATTGQVSSNSICVDMPLAAFGAGRPINGTEIFNVTALSGGRNNGTTDIHLESDATRSFNFTLNSAGPAACGTAALSLEADVTPRHNGDGAVSSTDVVKIREFQVGPVNPPYMNNEFQRADCAPYTTLGNGTVASTDVVQARRYQLGLDAFQIAGGPTTGGPVPPPADLESDENARRTVRVMETSGSPGQTVTVALNADAAGDEAVYGFTLNYDAKRLLNPVVTIGTDAVGGNLIANVRRGRIGISIDFNGAAIPAGENLELVRVQFTIAKNAPAGDAELVFTDDLAIREVSDTEANAVSTSYVNGGIKIAGRSRNFRGW